MAMTDQEVIETFMSVTGVTEESAIQKLQEHGGDLNEAVNAHFNGDRSPRDPTPTSAQSDFMDIDEPIRRDPPEPILSLFSTDRSFNPFSLLDHSFHPFGGLGDNFNRQAQRVSHPREVREIPIEFKDEPGESSPFAPKIEDVTGNVDVHEGMHGNVTIVNEKEEEALAAPTIVNGSLNESGRSFIDKLPEPSAPHIQSIADYDNDVEEEMLQAAIEASKQEVKRDITYQQIQSNAAEQDKALYKSAEHSRAVDQWDVNLSYGEGTDNQTKGLSQELGSSKLGNSNKLEVEDRYYSFQDEDEVNVDEQPLVRNRSRQATSLIGSSYSSKEYYQGVEERPNSVGAHNGDDFHSDEWGGMSSLERDESVMLEAALFGRILGSSGYNFGYNPDRDKQSVSDRNTGSFRQKVLQPPSPALLEQRLIREQQDDEYLAALQVDQEKAIRTLEEAERCRLEEDCARENMLNKRLLNEEIERQLADKQSSLPHEPASNDENAVSLLFRMPDGSRCTRRFLRSDRLQSLFDFIDVGQAVKTGTYRLVRPYPRRAFGGEESHLTLGELGLTGKQEAMFLELI